MSIGLTSSILTTKVRVGDDARIQSYREQEPSGMMCPMWGGQDLAGRGVCADSFWTKRAGCHSALDRIKVENDQRPKYANHVTISASGITGENADYGSNVSREETGTANIDRMSRHRSGPHFGLSNAESVKPTRSGNMNVSAANGYQSQDADALAAQQRRVDQNLGIGYASQYRYGRMKASLNPNTHVTYNSNANFMNKNGGNYATLGNMH